MEAAFVDIGKGRNAVLYAGEVNWDVAGLEGRARSIEHALKSGDNILVQVTKDPIGHKGARLTSQISLPGRYLVYVPNGSMTGISRKLPDTERARLKDILAYVHSRGVAVALDFNYRPALWPNAEAARAALDGVVPACRYVSLSSEDSRPLYGREAEDLAVEWAAPGTGFGAEVVARDESHAVNVHTPEGRIATPAPVRVKALDTTGAGDSFNAAYLSSRLAGLPVETAVSRGHDLAAAVVACKGAIIPPPSMPVWSRG